MNKTEIIQKIKQLEGLSNDERAYLVELVNTKKKYGLVWEDKPEDVEEQFRTHLPVLKEVVEKRIMSEPGFIGLKDSADSKKSKPLQPSLFEEAENQGNQENQMNPGSDSVTLSEVEVPNHILIEGDNLHALTALTFTHEGQIDVMYFDPPYDTGNKDFKYNDSFVDREDSYRHSKWLSFMDKRLQIAKRLLNEKGVIFISIDDNESSQLKVLMDEIFLESNFIAEFIHKNNSNKNQAKLVGISTEYIYCYAKDKTSLRGIEWKVSKKGAKDIALVFNKLKKQGLELDEIEKEIKLLYQRPKYSHLSRWNKVNNNGVFKDADLSREGGPKDYTIINPETSNPCKIPERGWGKSYDELIRLQNENLIWYGSDDTPPGLIDYVTTEDLTVPDSFLYFDNSIDTKWQKDVFGKIVFDNPKPLEMIQSIIEFQLVKDSIVLDIFAGSGTTLHATMQLNADDGGNRQCILVTNNENNIAEDVCYERNRRVIQGYTNSKGDWVPGLTNNNLRYYKTEFVDSAKTEENRRKLTQLSSALLQIKEDCYEEIVLPETVVSNQAQAFTNGKGKYLLVVYHHRKQTETSATLTAWIKQLTGVEGKIKLYAFSPETEILVNDFIEVAEKIDPIPLPDAIYNAYRNTFRTIGLHKRGKRNEKPGQLIENETEGLQADEQNLNH